MGHNRIGVLVITHNRPDLFERCLTSVLQANKKQKLPIVVVHQTSTADYREVIAKNFDKLHELIEIDGSSKNVEQNINHNRILGMERIFEKLDCDFMITVEDDAIIKNTAFDFCRLAVERYGSDPRFRGVNFGSRIPYDKNLEFTFSLLRYGCHGPASLLPRTVWEKSKLDQLPVISGVIAWDGWIEAYLKTGFMITPNLSMYMDLGTSGTHTPAFISDPYFKELQTSFRDSKEECTNIELLEKRHHWRNDLIAYKKFQNFEFQLRYYVNWIRQRVLDLS